MRLLSDEKLGEALWSRSRDFAAHQDFYNAIMDLGAAYRLLDLAHDPRLEEVRLDWEKCYHQLVSTEEVAQASTGMRSDNKSASLDTLIDRIRARKRPE